MKNKTLQLFITSNCNFKCKTCFGGFGRGDAMSFSIFCKAVDEAKKEGYQYITFTGGEPALHPEFEKMVEYVVKKGMLFSFVSNGSLLKLYTFITKKYKKNLYVAGFSVDGATKDVHDLVRQKGSLDLVIKSIKYFVSKGTRVVMEVCLNKLNYHQINKLFALAEKLKVQGISFSSAIDIVYNKKIILTEKDRLLCLREIASVKNSFLKVPLSIIGALQNEGGVKFCHALENESTLTVSPKGYYYFCTVTRFDSKQLGNVRVDTLPNVIKKYKQLTINLKKIRAQMLKKGMVPNNFDTCEFCNFFLKQYYQEKENK